MSEPTSDQTPAAPGRYVIVFADADAANAADAGSGTGTDSGSGSGSETHADLLSAAGVTSVADSRDFTDQAVDVEQALGADALVFAELGVAVVTADESQLAALTAAAAGAGRILAVEPEAEFHALHSAETSTETATELAGVGAAQIWQDTPIWTWGLLATGVTTSPWSGQGVRVAVLDTGFDLTHPDFAGRSVTSLSFVPGQAVQDGHGHGTHCIGTAAGPRTVPGGRGYGIAHEADIYAGKVLGDDGRGSDTNILAAINWAVAAGVEVISLSLGADLPRVSTRYETIGRRALAAGSLIVAAAGNNADRRVNNVGFVGVPANSPSILAVGALTPDEDIAYFSARSGAVRGGQVDIVAPGWAVYSSVPAPQGHGPKSGTSMATPHVAGIAALFSQATGHTGRDLWATLVQTARRLLLPSVDVGAGLVQAPQ